MRTSTNEINNDSTCNYGFGWMLRSDPLLGKIVMHTGDNPGYATQIKRYIDAGNHNSSINNAYKNFDEIIRQLE
jgi:hypothetical protein